MGSEESGDRVSQQSGGMVEQSLTSDHFYGSNNWDEIVSLSQSGIFRNSNMVHSQNEFANPNCSVLLQNQTMGSSSHSVHFPSDSGLVDIVTKIPSFGSGNFSEMNSSFDHRDESQYHSFAEKNGILGHSPYAKRKRQVLPLAASPKNAEEEQKKDQSGDTPKEDDEEKQKFEQYICIGQNSRSKQAVKECKNNPVDFEPSKENCIHMRAKRGQATNSHSLAERVRRERIGERMRLLQELVPGCNKITGKAMMLDEIINYVQSLQQQVEFLSMKLATVNPELNLDLDRILSKDILHLRGSNTNALGIAPSVSSSHPFSGYPHEETFNSVPSTTPPFNPVSRHIWNNELHGILQMGFDPDPSNSSLGQNGPSRMEP